MDLVTAPNNTVGTQGLGSETKGLQMLLCTEAAVWGGASQTPRKKKGLLSSRESSHHVMS